MGNQYSPRYVGECRGCGSLMVGSRAGRGNVMLDCIECENAWKVPLDGDYRVETIGVSYGADLRLDEMASLNDVVDTALRTEGLTVLDLNEARPLYYGLHRGDACPVRGCDGKIKRRTFGKAAYKMYCNTCDFETGEKDVS